MKQFCRVGIHNSQIHIGSIDIFSIKNLHLRFIYANVFQNRIYSQNQGIFLCVFNPLHYFCFFCKIPFGRTLCQETITASRKANQNHKSYGYKSSFFFLP